MTSELKEMFIGQLGTGTGTTRYIQFRDFPEVASLPMGEPHKKGRHLIITDETIKAYNNLTEEERYALFSLYRQVMKGRLVKLSARGLADIQEVTSGYNPNPQR